MPTEENHLTMMHSVPEELATYFASLGSCEANAVLIGTQIDLRALTNVPLGRSDSVMTKLSHNGIALIYRYGAIMFFNATVSETAQLIALCQPFTTNLFTKPETERFSVQIVPSHNEGIKEGKVFIQKVTKQRLEIIGNALSKSVTLDYQENSISSLFIKVEPIAKRLSEKGKLGHTAKELLQHIGATLLVSQEMIGKIEVAEKPTLLWEQPHLEPLYQQMFDDLELKERQEIINQKINLIAKTAETSLGVLEHSHSNRLEWYIIILIAIEIVLQLYELFFKPMLHG